MTRHFIKLFVLSFAVASTSCGKNEVFEDMYDRAQEAYLSNDIARAEGSLQRFEAFLREDFPIGEERLAQWHRVMFLVNVRLFEIYHSKSNEEKAHERARVALAHHVLGNPGLPREYQLESAADLLSFIDEMQKNEIAIPAWKRTGSTDENTRFERLE